MDKVNPKGQTIKQKKSLFLIGAGGLGCEIASAILNHSEFELKGFYDDNYKKGQVINDVPIVGTIEDYKERQEERNALITISDSILKSTIVKSLEEHKSKYLTFIHSNSRLENSSTITIGEGSIITSGVQITTRVTIGNHVLINLNTTIGHDVKIGDYSSIMPGSHLSGNVTIGKKVLIGTGAVILQGLTIGDNAIIGAGAVVTKDVKEGRTVVGIPAREK